MDKKKMKKIYPKLPEAVWSQIKAEYVSSEVSYRTLSDKYGVSSSAIQKKALEGGWREARDIFKKSVCDNSISKVAEEQSESVARALRIGFKLIEKVEQAVDQLGKTEIINTITCKETLADGTERISEEHEVKIVDSIIDRRGLKDVVSAFKQLAEIGIFKSELDRREQEARIAKLEHDVAEEDKDTNIIVTFAEEVVEDYAE